jgi:hypothetical protein
MRRRYKVDVAEQRIGGVVADVVTPAGGVAPENRGRLLINLHGGGFTTGARTASLVELVPIDCRMEPSIFFRPPARMSRPSIAHCSRPMVL